MVTLMAAQLFIPYAAASPAAGIPAGLLFAKDSSSPTTTDTNIKMTGIQVSQSTLNMTVGETKSISAAIAPDNATNKTLNWSSNNSSVASVNNGSITAIAAGTATITVSSPDGPSASVNVTVTAASTAVAVTGISLDRTSASMKTGDRITIKATVLPATASNQTVTWTSNNTAVAEVELVSNLEKGIHAKTVGTAIITATTADGNKIATCTVTVSANDTNTTVNTTPISNLNASVSSESKIHLSYSAPNGATNVRVERSTTSSTTGFSTYGYSGNTDSGFDVTGLDTGTQYWFRLVVSGGTNAGTSNVVNVTTSGSSNITDKTPSSGAKSVSVSGDIEFRFGKTMKKNTITSDNIYLRKSGSSSNVSASLDYNESSRRVTINPSGDLDSNTKYTVYVTSSVRYDNGDSYKSDSWDFTTSNSGSLKVTDKNPAENAKDVALDKQIVIKFSRELSSSTVNSDNFTLRGDDGKGNIRVTVSYSSSDRTVTIKPKNPLSPGVEYTVTVTSDVKDTDGNKLDKTSWDFTAYQAKAAVAQSVTPAAAQSVISSAVPVVSPVVPSVQIGTAYAPVVKMNGQYVNFADAKPYIKNKRTMLPMRTLFEMIGAQVVWDNAKQKVTATLNGNTVELFIGKKTATKNGKKISLDAAPEISKGRTMVPLRFAGESLGYQVGWDAQNYTVIFGQ